MFNKKESGKLIVPVGPDDHVQGPETAPITLVEYGDFECPHSQRAVSIVRELQQRFGDRIRFVFRHFPLPKHPNAERSSEAAEAATVEGKFWEMYHALFENQYALEADDLIGYAEAVGLDPARFEQELEQHTHLPRVRKDVRSGVESGATGTPEFFVNGVIHPGDYNIGALRKTIERTGLV
jgi:protein-disulfide isomerase